MYVCKCCGLYCKCFNLEKACFWYRTECTQRGTCRDASLMQGCPKMIRGTWPSTGHDASRVHGTYHDVSRVQGCLKF